jgi:type IV secretory pathway component VirB8
MRKTIWIIIYLFMIGLVLVALGILIMEIVMYYHS